MMLFMLTKSEVMKRNYLKRIKFRAENMNGNIAHL